MTEKNNRSHILDMNFFESLSTEFFSALKYGRASRQGNAETEVLIKWHLGGFHWFVDLQKKDVNSNYFIMDSQNLDILAFKFLWVHKI